MLNRRQFIQAVFDSLSSLTIPIKTKSLLLGSTHSIHNVRKAKSGLGILEKLVDWRNCSRTYE